MHTLVHESRGQRGSGSASRTERHNRRPWEGRAGGERGGLLTPVRGDLDGDHGPVVAVHLGVDAPCGDKTAQEGGEDIALAAACA